MRAEANARRFELARLVDAGGDQHRIVPRAQFFEARIAAEFEAQPEFDAAVVSRCTRRATTSFSSLKFGMP